jgi:hypothetical protein
MLLGQINFVLRSVNGERDGFFCLTTVEVIDEFGDDALHGAPIPPSATDLTRKD